MIGKFKLPFGGLKSKIKDQRSKVIILMGIAIVTASAIYNQQQTKLSSYPAISPAPSPTLVPRPLPDNLTADEKFILYPPSADASKSALKKHAQTVKKLAKKADTLEISNCQPKPLVLIVKQGSELTIKNNDNTKRWLIFDEDHLYLLPTNDSLTIKAEFKYGTGDYGYICKEEGSIGLIGFLHVVP